MTGKEAAKALIDGYCVRLKTEAPLRMLPNARLEYCLGGEWRPADCSLRDIINHPDIRWRLFCQTLEEEPEEVFRFTAEDVPCLPNNWATTSLKDFALMLNACMDQTLAECEKRYQRKV